MFRFKNSSSQGNYYFSRDSLAFVNETFFFSFETYRRINYQFFTIALFLIITKLCPIASASPLVTITGFSSFSDIKGSKISIKAQLAELSSSLKSQRLYESIIEVNGKNETIEVKSHEALFKKSEIILVSSVVITIHSKTKKDGTLILSSEKDPIIFDIDLNQISGASASLIVNNKNYLGRGFKLNLNNYEIRWISSFKELKSQKEFKVPYTLKLDL